MMPNGVSIFMRGLIIALIGVEGVALAYNDYHGPFPEDAQIERIALTTLVQVLETSGLDRLKPEAVFEHPEHRNLQLVITRSDKGRFARLVVNGETVLPLTHFSNARFYAGLMADSADLNRDGTVDFIIYSNYGGCGLACGNSDVAFILSHERKYTLTTVFTMFPTDNDFVILNNTPCFIHTSFQGVSRCNDRKHHNFWIYNLLVIGEEGLKVDNRVHDAFPKIIWYSYRPNHTETTLITESQKAVLRKTSLHKLCISQSAAAAGAYLKGNTGISVITRETAREKVMAILPIKEWEKGVIENGGTGIDVYVDEHPEAHLNGRYWEVHVYENYHDHDTRRVIFLVKTDGKEILILNPLDVGPRYRTLNQWSTHSLPR